PVPHTMGIRSPEFVDTVPDLACRELSHESTRNPEFPFFFFLGTLRSCFQSRAALQLEILALRHQINVLQRSQRGRVRLTQVDRLLWAWLLHLWSGWRS